MLQSVSLAHVPLLQPMNEPHRGYLELHSMYTFDSNTDLQLGYHANALESFALSDGYSLSIPYYVPSFPEPTRISRYEMVNQAGARAWANDKPCIWREHGVWEWDEKSQRPLPLRESYFQRDPRTGEAFEWYKDCWYPFLQKFQSRVAGDSQTRQSWMTFAAGIPNEVRSLILLCSRGFVHLMFLPCIVYPALATRTAAAKFRICSTLVRLAFALHQGQFQRQLYWFLVERDHHLAPSPSEISRSTCRAFQG